MARRTRHEFVVGSLSSFLGPFLTLPDLSPLALAFTTATGGVDRRESPKRRSLTLTLAAHSHSFFLSLRGFWRSPNGTLKYIIDSALEKDDCFHHYEEYICPLQALQYNLHILAEAL